MNPKSAFFSVLLCAFSFFCNATLPTVTAFSPATAATGNIISITGTNFTGTIAVNFGGTAANSFVVISATQINAVIAAGSSGSVQVINADGSASKTGFVFMSTPSIITDFGGFWSSSAATPNTVVPDTSHNLLAFTFNGNTFSTGVNNARLTAEGISFFPGNFRALPVAGISGIAGTTSTYLALAKKVDGSALVANTPAVANFSIKSVLTDGMNGLDLGTGITNLPTAAVLNFRIFSIDTSKIADNEPDLIITQIAQPVSGNDLFSFIDTAGNVVGTSLSQDMTLLPKFGTYDLDLFNLTPSTPYNSATAYSSFSTNTSREIRVVAFKLSDFNITSNNVSQVAALKITPSGNSDYAFIAYNANAMNLPPNITQDVALSNASVCSGGTANLSVVGSAADGGSLSYSWQQSVDGGISWTSINNGGNYSGALTKKLTVANAVTGYMYKATVSETNNSSVAVSAPFTISVITASNPSSVSIAGGGSICVNSAVQLTATATGGSNLFYQWQSNASGSYADIPGAVLNTYLPASNTTGAVSYNLRVTGGSGCSSAVTATTAAVVTVTGISSVASASKCDVGTLLLAATATSGTIDWFTSDAGGTSIGTGNSFVTPSLSVSKTYYVAASGCASALRVPVTATIFPLSVGGNTAGGTIVITGTNIATLTLSGSLGDIVKWQSSTDNFVNNIVDISNTSNSLTVNNLTQTTSYRAVLQSGSCSPSFSSAAGVVVTGTLAVHLELKASRQNSFIAVQWLAYDQSDISKYELEKSVDGINFFTVYIIAPGSSSGITAAYNWADHNPVSGTNFYRIKQVERSGRNEYSSIVKVTYENNTARITLFPNPITTHSLVLHFENIQTGTYNLRLINSIGQESFQLKLTHLAGTDLETIVLPGKITNGIYTLKITDRKSYNSNQNVMVL